MKFELVGAIADIQVIASGMGVRIRLYCAKRTAMAAGEK
jgi:hypothetical protein